MHPRLHAGHEGRFASSDARQHAFELMAFGPQPAEPLRRSHRGLLPDLPEPRPVGPRPSPVRRFLAWLAQAARIAAGGDAAAILAGSLRMPVGKQARTSYIGSDKGDETRHVPLV
jgi:hypothetical protein